jgi:hypothetical protein
MPGALGKSDRANEHSPFTDMAGKVVRVLNSGVVGSSNGRAAKAALYGGELPDEASRRLGRFVLAYSEFF